MKGRWLAVAAMAALIVLLATAIGGGLWGGTRLPSPTSAAAGATAGLAVPNGLPSSGSSGVSSPPSASPGVAPSPGTLEPLPPLLAMLRVAPENRAGYDRSLFVHWIDADGDGCDTRHEVLIAQAIVKPRVGAGCTLTGGTWVSLYDGLLVTDPAGLQIDHVVALAEAWDSGASTWTAARREAYANDLDVPFALLAVSAATNQSKSDDDPADWLPPAPAATCPFLGDWIAVKVRWDLAVDPRELDALAHDIRDCAATEMPYLPAGPAGEGGAGPTPMPVTGQPTDQVGGGCDPAYPTVCIPPPPPDLDCGDIPYRNFKVLPPDPHRFDGDHDGIGCET